jgi:hypothetical protein
MGWIRAGGSGDRSRSGGSAAVKERIARALRIYKEAAAEEEDDHDDGGVLVQVWAPARDGARRVLATRGQPFLLAPPQCHRLSQYRAVSLTHAFPVGGPGAAAPGERGMPGRVFDAGAPEWTPNVQYYGTAEYARIYDLPEAALRPRGRQALQGSPGERSSCLSSFCFLLTSFSCDDLRIFRCKYELTVSMPIGKQCDAGSGVERPRHLLPRARGATALM